MLKKKFYNIVFKKFEACRVQINGLKKTKKSKSKNIINLQSKQVHSENVFQPYEENSMGTIGEVALTTKHGVNLINDPLLNKGTAFSLEERERFGIRGLIPSRIIHKHSIEWQSEKILMRLRSQPTNLDKYLYLMGLQDRNEVLFHRCLLDNLEEIAPIIYTPTVGEACQKFALLFRRPRGMYFSSEDRGHMHAMSFNWHTDDVELIVVTDGSRILGLGDLGVNGMGIPIGKLAIYSACAGIHPSKCLPVVLDVGTNNQELLDSSLYLGLKQRRIVGVEYDEIIDEFISAVCERFPKALIQFEDFSTENAARILGRYRDRILCFNDDMQGTATVALSGILSSLKYIGNNDPQEALKEQRIVVMGAGSAGLGVSNGILFNMKKNGMSEEDALKNFWIIDDKGLLGNGRKCSFKNQEKWVRNDFDNALNLEQVVELVKPTIILGLTGVGGLFTEKAIREMAKYCKRPIVFPLSNPTHKAECTAEQAYQWTNGKCIFASGSPFKPVEYDGKIYIPSQSNNMYTYPGLGLGALVGEATKITDNMLNAAAMAVVDSLSEEDYEKGLIYPRISKIPHISKKIAVSVAQQAYEDGVVKYKNKRTDEELRNKINNRYWKPNYGSLVRVDLNKY